MLFTTFCGLLFSSKAWKQLFIEGAKPEAEDGEDEEDKDTLYSVLAGAGEVQSSRGSWRESGF